MAVLAILTLAVVAVKLIEDVVAKESGPVDEAILWFIRDHVPSAMNAFFTAITFSGSARFLVPVAVVAVVILLVYRRRFEALLLVVSGTTAMLLVWGLKTIVARARPELWNSQWYWGSSFPSGHTLNASLVYCGLALACAPLLGAWLVPAVIGGVAISFAVAFSRVWLGVHWPTDIAAGWLLGTGWWTGAFSLGGAMLGG